MDLNALADRLGWTNLTPELALAGRDVAVGVVSDFPSDVLAARPVGGVLVTTQVLPAMIGVGVQVGLSAIVFAQARRPDEATLDQAARHALPLLGCDESAFDVVGRMYALGMAGQVPLTAVAGGTR